MPFSSPFPRRLPFEVRRHRLEPAAVVGVAAAADLDQERRNYNLLESKVRFVGDKKMSEGNINGLEFNGKMFVGDPHCPPNKIDFLSKKSLAMYSAGKVAWQNQTTGGDILAWVQDEDAFVARAAKYCNLGTDRRNGLARLGDLLSD